MAEHHIIVTYQATGTKRDNRWRLGAPVEVYHEGREFPSILQAERSARELCRRYGGTWAVDERRSRFKASDHNRTVAKVSRDALGRLWTDVMTPPGQPALL